MQYLLAVLVCIWNVFILGSFPKKFEASYQEKKYTIILIKYEQKWEEKISENEGKGEHSAVRGCKVRLLSSSKVKEREGKWVPPHSSSVCKSEHTSSRGETSSWWILVKMLSLRVSCEMCNAENEQSPQLFYTHMHVMIVLWNSAHTSFQRLSFEGVFCVRS